MSHILNIVRVSYLKFRLRQYDRAKKVSIALFENKSVPSVVLVDRATYLWAKYFACGICRAKLRDNLSNRLVAKLIIHYSAITETGTFPNYVATSILGFLGGVLVTYFYFVFTTVAVDLSIHTVWYFSVLLCIFMTIGLAFFETIRCVFLSIIPEIFTRKVRNLLVSYAVLLAITGPGSNILFNTRQLTQTISCTKDQLNQVSHNLTELYMKPLRALRQGIAGLMNTIKPVVDGMRTVLETIRDGISSIVNVIRKGLRWLKGLAGLCTNRSGDPKERCLQAIRRGIEDCKVSLYPPINLLCQFNRIVGLTCYQFEFVDMICEFQPKLSFRILDSLEESKNVVNHSLSDFEGLGEVSTFIKTLFYVSVSFHHSFAFETNSTKTINTVVQNAYSAEKSRLKVMFAVLNGVKILLGAYLIFLLVSTFIYRQRFLHQLSYENYVINRFIVELDTKRASVGRQTIFPLTLTERTQYVSLFSLRFTTSERINIMRDTVFMLASVVEVFFIFVIDYALFWVGELINHHGRIRFYFGEDSSVLQGEGTGFWWYIYNQINNFFVPEELEFRFDTRSCLPDPVPPAWHLYKRIGYIFLLSWFTTLFQPFGLRFRNHVMSEYYPEVAQRRAVWLNNKILQSRGHLMLFIRRHFQRKSMFGLRAEAPSIKKWLLRRFPALKLILPYQKMIPLCAVCGYTNPHVKCLGPNCPEFYCQDCYDNLDGICLYCNMPQNFQFMDVSEEEDSESDEDMETSDAEPKSSDQNMIVNQGRTQSLKDIENAEMIELNVRPIERENLLDDSQYDAPKSYFGEEWRRSDWATLEDYMIPLPKFVNSKSSEIVRT